jgi:hypothetical protein
MKKHKPNATHNTENKNTHNKNKNNSQTEASANVVELNVISVENPSSEQVQNSLQLNSMNVTTTKNITLPTFTTTCKNKNNNNQDLRVLYDSGSEWNIITQNMAQKIKYKLIKSGIMLNIKGFNGNKYYQTHIIEVEVKIGDKLNSIVAAVVPTIQTKVNIPPPEILKAFHNHKIPLADRHLKNKNSREIHILLGVNGAHILPVIACSFGIKDNESLIYDSSIGMLLAGDLNKLMSNLPYLSGVKIFTEQVLLLQPKLIISNHIE